MLKLNEILDEKDKRLKCVSKEVKFPLTEKDINIINNSIEYLTNSQLEENLENEKFRPGMGLAAIQLGIPKRYFVIVEELPTGEHDPQKFKNYIVVNPKVVSHSEEMIYAELGEGCLSVNREVPGIVPRHARITIEGFNELGEPIKIRAREELSIAFQHEIDHLNGILFFERIDKTDPFNGENTMRSI